MQAGAHRRELFPVAPAVLAHMLFIAPGEGAGDLVMGRHGRAVIAAVAQECVQSRGVAGHEARAQSGEIGALRQRMHAQAIAKIVHTQRRAGGEQARRGPLFVGIDLGVALVRDQ